ncbi:unnamed protein product [Ambrosiozyma monospora]|uniref:Unnamed protein product n=1 Tax=Ambrosiozyma monospora TaxID=43982 RepID=A0A9W6WJ67_AMBMO|nr:unnamed protein product [Ambrosiozyma monospora]
MAKMAMTRSKIALQPEQQQQEQEQEQRNTNSDDDASFKSTITAITTTTLRPKKRDLSVSSKINNGEIYSKKVRGGFGPLRTFKRMFSTEIPQETESQREEETTEVTVEDKSIGLPEDFEDDENEKKE